MNRKQAEKLITGMMKQIVDIYKLYDPDASYLSLCFIKKGDENYISFDNCAHKAENPIDYTERF